MRPALLRLVFVSALFAGWIAYLAYLVATRPRTANGQPLVVSHPQILTSEIDIVADIPDPQGEITVQDVLWPEDAPIAAGEKIKVDNLDLCRSLRAGHPVDWTGPGTYLVPLRRTGVKMDAYEVAPIPSSPGFAQLGAYRIYPATPEAMAQYRTITKP